MEEFVKCYYLYCDCYDLNSEKQEINYYEYVKDENEGVHYYSEMNGEAICNNLCCHNCCYNSLDFYCADDSYCYDYGNCYYLKDSAIINDNGYYCVGLYKEKDPYYNFYLYYRVYYHYYDNFH